MMDGINSINRGFTGVEASKPTRPTAPVEPAVEKPIATVSPTQAAQPANQIEEVDLDQALNKLKEVVDRKFKEVGETSELVIRRDEDRFVYEFVDPESGEVIRKFPSKSAVDIVQNIRSPGSGLIIDQPT
jgi:uncharacterized FlaG/YvyC family protein